MTWLDKLCGPLLNPQYPQIKGTLTLLSPNGDILGKCAEGEIACQNGIKYPTWQHTLRDADLRELGIPDDFVDEDCLPSMWVGAKSSSIDFDQCVSIGSYIYGLNDSGFTYPQLVEFLQTTFEDAV